MTLLIIVSAITVLITWLLFSRRGSLMYRARMVMLAVIVSTVSLILTTCAPVATCYAPMPQKIVPPEEKKKDVVPEKKAPEKKAPEQKKNAPHMCYDVQKND